MKYFIQLDKLDATKVDDILKPHGEIGTYCIENMRIIRSDALEKMEEYTNSYLVCLVVIHLFH